MSEQTRRQDSEIAFGVMARMRHGVSRLGEAVRDVSRNAGLRLGARRWQIAVVAAIVCAFVAVSTLPFGAGLAGIAVFAISCAIVPRTRPLPLAGATAARPVRDDPVALMTPMVEALPDAAIVLDRALGVITCNDKARDLLPALVRGAHISTTIRAPEFLNAASAVAGSESPRTVTYAERVPVERRIEATLAMLRPGGRNAGPATVLVCFRDLTERERISQMRADFVTNASHELRTPLASLLGFIETLQGSARDDADARGRFLEIMASQANRMKRLIDDLLSLSRVEMKAHVRPEGSVDLGETLRYVADTLDPLAAKSDIALELTGADTGAFVRGDRDELVQVFQNLIQNAIKYGRSGGHVRVALERCVPKDASRARFAVSITDDGPGIAPEHLPRLTERFYRVDVASSREKGGTGLGLAIVKHVVNRHRGDLTITSDTGAGSTFTVTLDEVLAAGAGVHA